MDCKAFFLSYAQTGFFSKIVLDYLQQAPAIRPFYEHEPTLAGIEAAMAARGRFPTDRQLLVRVLKQQYASIEAGERVLGNIELLAGENSFTVCTAHQPNIFTGPLYFIYKILHAISLAEELTRQFPGKSFIPVYYMGSEDADLEELGHIYIDGERAEWETGQHGAVGRMKVDKALLGLIKRVSGQLLVHPHGAEIVALINSAYQEGTTIEKASFFLVNKLFEQFGLVILLPDNAELKRAFSPVIRKELTDCFSHPAVEETIAAYPADYKAQASGRAINLFYLDQDKRERIEKDSDGFRVVNTDLSFSGPAMMDELAAHPERFSPNVILRPVFQEWILPDVAFIGGGGEIAYWLQLKKVFGLAGTPYPVLVLRNSFMLVKQELRESISKLQLDYAALFQTSESLFNLLVKRDSDQQLSLAEEQRQMGLLYEQVEALAGRIDATLKPHTAALRTQAMKKLVGLEKKMLRAEKKKFEASQRRLQKIKGQLFPHNNLQERMDNLLLYYAIWGSGLLHLIHDHSKGLQQEFGVLELG
jgi:bacillithiol biosynthesis cysteine-adding enzyme BshC